MLEHARTAEIVEAIRGVVPPEVCVTVKCRTHVSGIAEDSAYESLKAFRKAVGDAGASELIVHARKGILGGLSTKKNRTVPPLCLDKVHRLAADREGSEGVRVSINGGIDNMEEVSRQLEAHPNLDGVMVGRSAYLNPWGLLSDADYSIFGEAQNPMSSRRELLLAYSLYAEAAVQDGTDSRSLGGRTAAVLKPVMNLMAGELYAKHFRRAIHGAIQRQATPSDCIAEAVAVLDGFGGAVLDDAPGAAGRGGRA